VLKKNALVILKQRPAVKQQFIVHLQVSYAEVFSFGQVVKLAVLYRLWRVLSHILAKKNLNLSRVIDIEFESDSVVQQEVFIAHIIVPKINLRTFGEVVLFACFQTKVVELLLRPFELVRLKHLPSFDFL
jgi:iron only hydrogenase large subunit-like protein